MGINPFDFIKEILFGKTQLIVDINSEKDYVPFIVNRGLSYHRDCLMQSNEMNRRHFLSKKMQNDYYLNTIRSYKRPFVKWGKAEKIEHLDNVKKFFKCSIENAKDILRLLSEDDVREIIKLTDTGGMMGK